MILILLHPVIYDLDCLTEKIFPSVCVHKIINFVTFEQVITTYATLGSDFSKATQATRHGSGFAEQFCPLLTVNWWRVVLDESHTVSSFRFSTIISYPQHCLDQVGCDSC
jgi:SNF2 family DNA or RNA helicase